MKTFFFTFIVCLLNLPSTEIIGKYQIESEDSFDTLELRKDNTYEYKVRGKSFNSWMDITGSWILKDGVLIFNHNYQYEEETIKYILKKEPASKGHNTFGVIDLYENPIPEFEVKYLCNNNVIIKKTNKKGIVKFKKCDLLKSGNSTIGIELKYVVNGKVVTETTSFNKNFEHVLLRINNSPKTIKSNRKYRFAYKNGSLKSIDFPYVKEMSSYKKL